MSSRGTSTGIVSRLKPDRRVTEQEVSLQPNGGSVKAALMKEAIRHSGRDEHNPGEAMQYYLRDEELLVIDLGGRFDDDGE